jgi:SAM-dependent methyltransferase
MSTGGTIDAINQRIMSTVVADYSWRDDFHDSERAALGAIVEAVKGSRILDLGVGAGRTVKGLRELSRHYVGVDYVQEMVDHCRKRFPGVRFERGDARSMPQFADESFDLVVFSCNGICMVDHAGRMRIFSEVRRLLAPGGHFVFSTSNRNDPNAGRFRLPGLRFTPHPIKLGVRTWRFAVNSTASIVNRLRLKPSEVHTNDYAILNDRSHYFGTMNYFITLQKQLTQLREHGFHHEPHVFDELGRPVVDDTTHGTMTFVARKPIEQLA